MRARPPQLLLSSIALLSLLCSCSGSVRFPSKTSEAYGGPPLALASTPPQHRVILTAPSAGWSFLMDQSRRAFDHTDVFLTIIRPNPAYMHTQAQVHQEAATDIDPSEPVVIYARVLAHDAKAGDQAYSPVPMPSATPAPH